MEEAVFGDSKTEPLTHIGHLFSVWSWKNDNLSEPHFVIVGSQEVMM